ncbi:MAG: hemerythrin family protein [Gallionella sp.]
MIYIHWHKNLELGNDLIDTQHRMLVLLCRKLDIAIKTKQSEQTIRWVMHELRKFTEFHFVSEENLMHEIGYPNVDDHALVHSELLMQLEMMLAKISHHKEFPEDLLHFLNKWLMQHVVQEDMKIAEFSAVSDKHAIGEELYEQFLSSEDS